jgi:hypothetical protein
MPSPRMSAPSASVRERRRPERTIARVHVALSIRAHHHGPSASIGRAVAGSGDPPHPVATRQGTARSSVPSLFSTLRHLADRLLEVIESADDSQDRDNAPGSLVTGHRRWLPDAARVHGTPLTPVHALLSPTSLSVSRPRACPLPGGLSLTKAEGLGKESGGEKAECSSAGGPLGESIAARSDRLPRSRRKKRARLPGRTLPRSAGGFEAAQPPRRPLPSPSAANSTVYQSHAFAPCKGKDRRIYQCSPRRYRREAAFDWRSVRLLKVPRARA